MTDAVSRQQDLRIELPTFENAITLTGCTRAIVALAWVYHRQSTASHLVLGQVDLVPDEIPRIDCTPDSHRRLKGDSDWTVFFESQAVSSEIAFEWYDSVLRSGQWTPRWRTQPLTNARPLDDRLNEPQWPSMVTLREAHAVPFASRRGAGARSNHLLSARPALASLLGTSELRQLFELTGEHYGIDLDVVPELLQSVHVFQPLPLLRHVSSRLFAPDNEPDRAILLNVVPRRGVSFENLGLEVFEFRSTGWRMLCRTRLQGPFCRLPLRENVEQIALRVVHDDLGLLVEEGPYSFIRRFSLEMDLIDRERRVQIPERKGRPATVKRIPISSPERTVTSADERPSSASRLLSSVGRRLMASAGAKNRQRWFRGEEEAAEQTIQGILSSAKETAMLVDPYFAADDIQVWLPVVARRGVEIKVLTSRAGLRQRTLPGVVVRGRDLELEHVKRLSEGLKAAERDQVVNPTRIRLMRGKHPVIHDRFIVADDHVWLLGASLNEFGARGTMLVALPLPGEVLPELEKVWDTESVSLDDRLRELTLNEDE